jgi:hypothetical protein
MSINWNNRDMTPEDIANSCEDAAAILEGNWIRGQWYDPMQASYCVEGALAAALGLDIEGVINNTGDRELLRKCPVYTAVQQTVIDRIILITDDEYIDAEVHAVEDDGLPYWNDQDGRVEQEVLDVLHATAKRVLGVEA